MEKLLSEERVEEILRLGVCNCLPWTIINACYDYVSSQNLINDAENQLNDYIQSRLNEGLEAPLIENVQLDTSPRNSHPERIAMLRITIYGGKS